jgi:hypothetical protein
MVDLDVVLGPVRGHPSLPEPPPLDEIVTRSRRRRMRRAGLLAALAVVVVTTAAALGDGDGDQRVASSSGSTRPPTTRTRSAPAAASATTTPGPPTTATALTIVPPPSTPARPTTTAPPPITTTVPRAGATPAKTSTIEDTHVGTGAGTVEYTGGSWTRCGGCDVATGNSSYYYGYVAGESYTVTFRGVALKVYAPSDKDGGVARVTVDGRPPTTATVAFLTSGTPTNGLRWDSGLLPDGLHRVVFTIQPGTDEVVLFDHADVYAG